MGGEAAHQEILLACKEGGRRGTAHTRQLHLSVRHSPRGPRGWSAAELGLSRGCSEQERKPYLAPRPSGVRASSPPFS